MKALSPRLAMSKSYLNWHFFTAINYQQRRQIFKKKAFSHKVSCSTIGDTHTSNQEEAQEGVSMHLQERLV